MAQGARQQRLGKEYDCVVVGAGNGGLGAAGQLAARGARVLLLEQHNLPGGFATSFVRGRFEFEAALHQIADIGSPTDRGNLRTFLEDDLGIHLDWLEVPEAYRLILTDPGEELDVTMPFGTQAFIDALEREVPGSRATVTNYVDLCHEVYDAITYLGQSRGNPDRKILMTKYANFLKTAPYTMDQVADALQIPERVRKILHAQWVYLGPPTNRVSFTIFGSMLSLFLRKSAWIPRQRSHEFALALDTRIRELGGDIQYNTRVEEIRVRDGRVTGVVTSRGDRINTRHVISNASPTLTYNHLIHPKGEVPDIALRECKARIHSLSGLVVYMGLDATLEEVGLDGYTIFVLKNMDTEALYESTKTLDAPGLQAALCMNNAIPDCSPPGTSIVSLTALVRPEPWQAVRPQDYVTLKNRIASDLITHFEQATGTSLRPHIEEFEVATPQTLARYTGAFNGTIYGYEPEPWDSLIPRVMMMLEEDKYIDGLRFCGGSAFRAHGCQNATTSGQTAALLALRDMDGRG